MDRIGIDIAGLGVLLVRLTPLMESANILPVTLSPVWCRDKVIAPFLLGVITCLFSLVRECFLIYIPR